MQLYRSPIVVGELGDCDLNRIDCLLFRNELARTVFVAGKLVNQFDGMALKLVVDAFGADELAAPFKRVAIPDTILKAVAGNPLNPSNEAVPVAGPEFTNTAKGFDKGLLQNIVFANLCAVVSPDQGNDKRTDLALTIEQQL
jgi:hypothetical protein